MKAFSVHILRLKNDERGTALIELAVVLPILLSICLGVFEFGNAIYGRHLIENGVRDAARYAAGLDANDLTAIANAKNIAVTGAISGGSLRVSWWNPFGANPSTCDPTTGVTTVAAGPGNGTVSVVYPLIVDDGTFCGTSGSHAYCNGRDVSGNLHVVTVKADIPYQGLGFLAYLNLSTPCMHVEHKERWYGIR